MAWLAGAAWAATDPSSDLRSLSQDPKQWPMAPHDHANTRYSALDQINTRNVGRLAIGDSSAIKIVASPKAKLAVSHPPTDTISDQLFCIHMVQHLLLMLVASPLLVLGRPAVALLWAFPAKARRRIGRVWTGLGLHRSVHAIMHPVAVWLIFFAAFIVWHFPGPYQAALDNEAIHTAEHLSFLVSVLMFWSIVIEPSGRRLGYGATFIFVASIAVVSAMPGALLALAQRPLYPAYAGGAAAWGITQLEDQQLAGVVMWIPGGFIYVLAAAIVFVKWLHEAERHAPSPLVARPAVLAVLAMIAAGLMPLFG